MMLHKRKNDFEMFEIKSNLDYLMVLLKKPFHESAPFLISVSALVQMGGIGDLGN